MKVIYKLLFDEIDLYPNIPICKQSSMFKFRYFEAFVLVYLLTFMFSPYKCIWFWFTFIEHCLVETSINVLYIYQDRILMYLYFFGIFNFQITTDIWYLTDAWQNFQVFFFLNCEKSFQVFKIKWQVILFNYDKSFEALFLVFT